MDGISRDGGPDAWPTALAELDPAERLIVWSFRCGALAMKDHRGHHMCLVWNEYARQLGAADARAALAGFLSIMRALGEYARRSLRHHSPCCPCLGVDEAWLVCLVGACQRGEPRAARCLAEMVVVADGVGDLLGAADCLGRAMAGHALALPPRTGGSSTAGPVSPTIH